MKIKRYAERTHITWTPDAVPKEEQKLMTLVRTDDLNFLEKEFEERSTIFIESSRLGLFQWSLTALLNGATKRIRQREFKNLEHSLTLMKLIPKGFGVTSIGTVVRSDGTLGLQVDNSNPTRVQPPQGDKDAT